MQILLVIAYGAALMAVSAGAAAAQEPPQPPLSRGDVHVVAGWQNIQKEQPRLQANDWMNGIFYAGAGAGWYWTDHLKTQIDVGTGTPGRQYRYEPVVINGQPTSVSSRVAVRQQSLAVGQQYQFFRNQWFHPHVAAGLDLVRQTTTEEFSPVVLFDNPTRTSREVRPGRIQGPERRLLARPFGEMGFKTYMTRRAFFTADTRVMFAKGVDEVVCRFGFGVDF